MKSLLILLIASYGVYAAIMVWLHPKFIYPFQPDDRVLSGFSRVELATDDGPIFLQERSGDGPVVLYFMGNAGAVPLFETAFDRHIRAGRHVIAMEYRGGGGRPGRPSEARLKADAMLAAEYALSKGKLLIVQGFSMGTGLATHISARKEVAAIVLTAPYDRMCSLMTSASFLPACWLPVQRWNAIADARRSAAPMLVLHGAADTLIPPSRSEIYEGIPGARRVVIPDAGHADIGAFPAFDEEIASFIDALGLN